MRAIAERLNVISSSVILLSFIGLCGSFVLYERIVQSIATKSEEEYWDLLFVY